MTTPSRSVRPLRYSCEFWDDQPTVSYNCGLGTTNARHWAEYTARNYGARVLVEYSDGTAEIHRDYGAPSATVFSTGPNGSLTNRAAA